MKEPLNRRGRIRAITFTAAAFVVLFGVIFNLIGSNMYYKRLLVMNYARSLSQLTESVDKMDSALEKSVYVTSGNMISSLCSEIYGEAQAARQAAGEMPYADLELEKTTAFLSKVGDYAQALAKSAAKNDGYSGDELENVKALSAAASTLSTQLTELEARLNEGNLTLEEAKDIEKRISTLTEGETLTTGSRYEAIETEFPEMPTLIYDGPFSDHIQSRGTAMLDHEEAVSENKAQRMAAEFLRLTPSQLTPAPSVEGEIPCYCFNYTSQEAPCTVQVTKKGGYILSFGSARSIGAETLSRERAVELAKAFLQERDIDGMEETYFIDEVNSLTINFASVQGGVRCYPDLIKVEVAMDNGEIVGFESAGYLANHTERKELKPSISKEEAQKSVSGELEVLDSMLTLIPTSGKNELLCWEFKCENAEGKHYIVYINAETGAEQQILILLEDENGTLVM